MKPTHGGKRAGAGKKPTGPTRVKISLTLSPEADTKAREVARKRGISVSALVDAEILNLPAPK